MSRFGLRSGRTSGLTKTERKSKHPMGKYPQRGGRKGEEKLELELRGEAEGSA